LVGEQTAQAYEIACLRQLTSELPDPPTTTRRNFRSDLRFVYSIQVHKYCGKKPPDSRSNLCDLDWEEQ